jgi:hypothetical protein
MFKFIGTPLGLITFNEYIYLAENKIDIDLFKSALELNNLSTDISKYPISLSGYPMPLPNTSNMYFQNDGLWYRETGGANASIDITSGNNPHAGPYDGGFKYINQFKTLIPNFSSVTVSSETITTNTKNLFTNYNSGTMTSYTGNTYIDITTQDGTDFSDCYVVDSTVISDPKHRKDLTIYGCDTTEVSNALSVCVRKKYKKISGKSACEDEIASQSIQSNEGYYTYDFNQYNIDGTLYSNTYKSEFVNKTCCNSKNTIPYYYDKYTGSGTTDSPFTLVNSGYICCDTNKNTCGCLVTCKWKVATQRWVTIPTNSEQTYLQFVTPDGTTRVTSQDGCNCVGNGYTVTVPLSASTTDVGYACQLTKLGMLDIDTPESIIYKLYNDRIAGNVSCNGK